MHVAVEVSGKILWPSEAELSETVYKCLVQHLGFGGLHWEEVWSCTVTCAP